jgi:hypothetical protein
VKIDLTTLVIDDNKRSDKLTQLGKTAQIKKECALSAKRAHS